MSRGGKANGKYAKFLNVHDAEKDVTESIDWGSISEWKSVEEEILLIEESNELAIMEEEIKKWKRSLKHTRK